MIQEYLEKLEAVIKEHGLKIKIGNEGETFYDMNDESITIGKERTGMSRFAAITHEFGHHLDFSKMPNKEKIEIQLMLGIAREHRIQHLKVLTCEFQAWINGERVLKKLGFNILDPEYVKYKMMYFGSYVDDYK